MNMKGLKNFGKVRKQISRKKKFKNFQRRTQYDE